MRRPHESARNDTMRFDKSAICLFSLAVTIAGLITPTSAAPSPVYVQGGPLWESESTEHTRNARVRKMADALDRLAAIDLNDRHTRECTGPECHRSAPATASDGARIWDMTHPESELRLYPKTSESKRSSRRDLTNCEERCVLSGGGLLECIMSVDCTNASGSPNDRTPSVSKRTADRVSCMSHLCNEGSNIDMFLCGMKKCNQ